MTQVLSVSANTAAYASEANKPAPRISRRSEVELAIYELARQAQQGEDHRLKAMMTVVKPPALALYFMTANRNAHPQATFDQTMAAYSEQRQDMKQKTGT